MTAPRSCSPSAVAPVTVASNGILGDCDVTTWGAPPAASSPCAFSYDANLTPTLSGIVSFAGEGLTLSATEGDLLQLTGDGFRECT